MAMLRIPAPSSSGVPLRALLISGLALVAAVVGNVAFAGAGGSHETLLWLLAVLPAFLLSYYRGWGGVAMTLAAGMVAIVATEVGLQWTGHGPVDPMMLTGVVAAFLGISLSVGWLSGTLHRERERAERSFRSLQEAALEGSRDGIFLFDADGALVRVNQAGCELTGYDEDELLSMRISDLHAEEDVEPYREHYRSVLAGEELTEEVRILRKDDRKVEAEISARPVEIGGERFVHTAVRDVTARREAQRRERRLATAVEQSTEMILILKPDGRVEYANPAFERITGYAVEEVVGRRPFDIDAEGALPIFPGDHWSRVREAEPVTRRHEARHRNGSGLELQTTLSPLRDEGGRLQNVVLVGHDVSELKRLEEHMRKGQKMEELGSVTGGIAHDFNNLLAVILSNVEHLADELPDLEPRLREALEDIQQTAGRGADLVERILLFARDEPARLEHLDVEEALVDLKSTVQRLITPQIEVRLSVDGPLPRVRLGPSALQQIVLNLGTNARDAMPDGGVFRIQARLTTLVEEDVEGYPWVVPGDYLLLRFEDNGAGMDRETRDRIFEPLFTTKAAGHGTGLGMAVIYGLVKQHEGFVHVYSEPGEGTAVCVYLPEAAAPEEAPAREAAASGDAAPALPGGSETILVIEDEDALRRSTKRALERLGYRVFVAASGEEGLSVYGEREDEIDLVLSDLVMPGMSGRDVLRSLRRDEAGPSFILMSGYSAREDEGAEPPESDAFVQKPWTVHDLATSVRETLDGRAPD